jgi:hypothetical protein
VIVLEAVFFPPLPVIVKVGVVDMIYFPIIGFYKFVFFGWHNAKYTPRT